jgi:hypothetical protein
MTFGTEVIALTSAIAEAYCLRRSPPGATLTSSRTTHPPPQTREKPDLVLYVADAKVPACEWFKRILNENGPGLRLYLLSGPAI